MVRYTLEMIDGDLAIVSSNAEVLPIELLDKYRLLTSPNQIGWRYWDEEWQSWSYEIRDVKPGANVTNFIGGE